MNPAWQQAGLALYHGDCRDVLAAMEPESVSCIITDPPYNVGKDFGNGRQADQRDDYLEWLWGCWEAVARVAKAGAFLIYTNRIRHLEFAFRPPAPWRYFHVAVWHKPLSLAGTFYGIAPHWEPIIIWSKGKPWRPFRNQDVLADVISENVVSGHRRGWLAHPTVKPYRLCARLMDFACPPGGLLLDPFCGTGTVLVAAQDKGYSAIGIDASDDYLRQAVRRLTLGDAGVRRQVRAQRAGVEQLAMEEVTATENT